MIVSNGSRDGAALHSETLDESEPHLAGSAVSLDHRHLKHVGCDIRDGQAGDGFAAKDSMLGGELVRPGADDPDFFASRGEVEMDTVPGDIASSHCG